MKKEKLITSFALANSADALLTWVAIERLNFQEINIYAHKLIEEGGIESALLLKFSLTTLLIFFYALTNNSESRFAFSSEKALQIGNVLVWLAVLYNIVQISKIT